MNKCENLNFHQIFIHKLTRYIRPACHTCGHGLIKFIYLNITGQTIPEFP